MEDKDAARLRLKLPTGAELEVEGSRDFVQAERAAFVAVQNPAREATASAEAGGGGQRGLEPPWESIIEARGAGLQLRAKLRDEGSGKDACLVLLAAAQKLLRLHKPTAAQIAKWLRASGYPITRVDRAIAEGLDNGEILASGSRRSRRYELSGPGKLKAFLLSRQLVSQVQGD